MSSQVAKPAKPAPDFCMLADRFRRHQLGALRAEQIGEVEQEEFDLLVLGDISRDRPP